MVARSSGMPWKAPGRKVLAASLLMLAAEHSHAIKGGKTTRCKRESPSSRPGMEYQSMTRIVLFPIVILAVLIQLGLALTVLGLDALLPALGLTLGSLLAIVAGIAVIGAVASLARCERSARRLTAADDIERATDATERWLLTAVHRHAREAGIAAPAVAVFSSPGVNSFAVGSSQKRALVAVSSGLLTLLSEDEAEAVVAHEVAHVANGDMVTMGLVQGILNTLVIHPSERIGHLIDRVVFRNNREHGPAYRLTQIVLLLALGGVAWLMVLRFSRWREFRADLQAAELAGRANMIAALEQLDAVCAPLPLPGRLRVFGIAGHGDRGLSGLFATHPPLDKRVMSLEFERHPRGAAGDRRQTESA